MCDIANNLHGGSQVAFVIDRHSVNAGKVISSLDKCNYVRTNRQLMFAYSTFV